MDRHTWGNSQSAINLTTILERPEYKECSDRVCRVLSKYMASMKAISYIPDKSTRETVLIMWHNRIVDSVDDLPEVVRTHFRCVAKGRLRQLIRESQRRNNDRHE